MAKRLHLEEFIALFDDVDPWAVSPAEWNRRQNIGLGICIEGIVLTDPEYRDFIRGEDGDTSDAVKRIDAEVERRRASMPPQAPDMTLWQRLARVVRNRRRVSGLSLRSVSRLTGYSLRRVIDIENAVRPMRIDELEKLAGILESTPAALLERAKIS